MKFNNSRVQETLSESICRIRDYETNDREKIGYFLQVLKVCKGSNSIGDGATREIIEICFEALEKSYTDIDQKPLDLFKFAKMGSGFKKVEEIQRIALEKLEQYGGVDSRLLPKPRENHYKIYSNKITDVLERDSVMQFKKSKSEQIKKEKASLRGKKIDLTRIRFGNSPEKYQSNQDAEIETKKEQLEQIGSCTEEAEKRLLESSEEKKFLSKQVKHLKGKKKKAGCKSLLKKPLNFFRRKDTKTIASSPPTPSEKECDSTVPKQTRQRSATG